MIRELINNFSFHLKLNSWVNLFTITNIIVKDFGMLLQYIGNINVYLEQDVAHTHIFYCNLTATKPQPQYSILCKLTLKNILDIH